MLKLETRDDLQGLIDDEIKEDLHLEFKGGPAIANTDKERNELSKDISAMANADGGQIVYGVKEDKTRGVASEFWPVDGSKYTRETLEQVVRSKISPPIEGLLIRSIQIGTSPQEVAYVVEIPRAISSAPHQASDRKYYRRHGITTDAMADYEIREAMRRSIDPDLFATLKFDLVNVGSYFSFGIFPTLFNKSSEPALYSALTIFFDKRLQGVHHYSTPFSADSYVRGMHPNGFELSAITAHLAPPTHFPVFRERGSPITPYRWQFPGTLNSEHFGVGYRIAAPGCEREEFFTLHARNYEIVGIEKAA